MSENAAAVLPPPVDSTKDVTVAAETERNSSKGKTFLVRLLPPLFAVVTSTVAAIVAMRLWNMHLGVPLEYGGDSLAHGMHFQQIAQNGWFWNEPRLGAPFSQNFQDWPLPDITSLATAWVLALFTSNWAVVQNGIFLLSFPLAALSAWWVLKKIGVSPWMAAAAGVLFSLLPYHHVRGEQHLFLSNYYVVPLAVLLAVRACSGEPLFSSTRRFRSRMFRFASWQTVQTLVLCALVGLGGIYYAAFALLFIATAVVVRVMQTHKVRAVVPGAVAACAIVFFALLATSPAILYHQENGANSAATERQASDTDVYGLKIAQMLVPSPGHRIDAFNDFQNNYLGTFPLPGERGSAALGSIASFGLLYMLALAMTSLVRTPGGDARRQRRRQMALFALVGIVVAVVGGLSTLVSLLVSSQIRSWNRMSIFIGFFALACVVLLVDSARARMKRNAAKWIVPVAVVAITGVGFLDQTNSEWVPDYRSVDAAFLSDQRFFQGVEATMPTASKVYELPRMEFPESPAIGSVGSYDLLKPYLHTKDLEWSFGGLKGRVEAEWQDRLDVTPAQELPRELIAAGFTGLYIDRNGYQDNAAQIESQVQSVVNASPVVDSFGKKSFFDLREYAAELQRQDLAALRSAGTQVTYPVAFVGTSKFYAEESNDQERWIWADGTSGTLVAENASKRTQTSTMSFGLRSTTSTPSNFTVTWPDGSTQRVSANTVAVPVTKTVDIDPGPVSVRISTDAPRLSGGSDPRPLHFQVVDPDIKPGS